MHALYALDGLSALAANDMTRGLADSHPRVREHALRLAERFAANSEAVCQAVPGLVDDSDAAVRLQVAFSLGSLPVAERIAPLMKILARDGDNSRFRVAIQSSLASGAAEFITAVLHDEKARAIAHSSEFLATLANQIGRSKQNEEVRAVVVAIDELSRNEEAAQVLAKELVIALLAEGNGASVDELAERSPVRVKDILSNLLTTARTTALSQDENADSRLNAITILGCGSFAAQRPTFDELLAPQQPQPVQEAVMKILGRFTDTGVVELLLNKWPSLTPGIRASATEILLSRPKWAEALLSAVQQKVVAAGDFDPARVALLKSHPSAKVRELAGSVFAGAGIARRADVVAGYQPALKLNGDVEKGLAVFEKSCAACHKLERKGTQVGADLKAIREKGPEAVMLNILDPNREINPRFLTYTATTTEGRVITGMILEETPNNLTIRQADGVAVPLNRTEIDEIESTGMSYMPEGLESQIDHQAMAHLLAYLMSAGNVEKVSGSNK
jgi:putative heme-binding domain-containing protein